MIALISARGKPLGIGLCQLSERFGSTAVRVWGAALFRSERMLDSHGRPESPITARLCVRRCRNRIGRTLLRVRSSSLDVQSGSSCWRLPPYGRSLQSAAYWTAFLPRFAVPSFTDVLSLKLCVPSPVILITQWSSPIISSISCATETVPFALLRGACIRFGSSCAKLLRTGWRLGLADRISMKRTDFAATPDPYSVMHLRRHDPKSSTRTLHVTDYHRPAWTEEAGSAVPLMM